MEAESQLLSELFLLLMGGAGVIEIVAILWYVMEWLVYREIVGCA